MKKVRMNISHFRFILFNLKIFGEIVTTFLFYGSWKSTDNTNWQCHVIILIVVVYLM